VIQEYVSSITSSEEFFVVDGDTNEEFEACKHKQNSNDINNHNKSIANPSHYLTPIIKSMI